MASKKRSYRWEDFPEEERARMLRAQVYSGASDAWPRSAGAPAEGARRLLVDVTGLLELRPELGPEQWWEATMAGAKKEPPWLRAVRGSRKVGLRAASLARCLEATRNLRAKAERALGTWRDVLGNAMHRAGTPLAEARLAWLRDSLTLEALIRHGERYASARAAEACRDVCDPSVTQVREVAGKV